MRRSHCVEKSRAARALKAAGKRKEKKKTTVFVIGCLLNCGWQQCPGRGNFWKPPPQL